MIKTVKSTQNFSKVKVQLIIEKLKYFVLFTASFYGNFCNFSLGYYTVS